MHRAVALYASATQPNSAQKKLRLGVLVVPQELGDGDDGGRVFFQPTTVWSGVTYFNRSEKNPTTIEPIRLSPGQQFVTV